MAFGRGKSNHTLARSVFFYQHCFTKIIEAYCCEEKHMIIIEAYCCEEKHMINTMVKKMHTLVKKNTPSCHKIGQQCGFTQNASFFSVVLCFHPHCQANIGRQVRLIPPNTYQEIYDTHTCLNFWKTCQNVCLCKTC